MHRNKILELLDAFAARNRCDEVVRLRRFVLRQPRCFDRDCWDDGHVTASAAVLDPTGTRMLLTHHAKLGKWIQLGGHADGDPDPLAVACREALEESGLAVAPVRPDIVDLDIHAIPAYGREPAHLHYDVRFLLQARASRPLKRSSESLALRWVALDRIDTVTGEPSVLRLAAKCLALGTGPRRSATPTRPA